jgi:hypothetical protein
MRFEQPPQHIIRHVTGKFSTRGSPFGVFWIKQEKPVMKATKIWVKGTEITILDKHGKSYISLTDIIRPFGNEAILYNWLRNKNTIEFLGLWEKLNNPDFKPIEFDRFKNMAGLNRFVLSPKQWVTSTDAIGFIVKSGR